MSPPFAPAASMLPMALMYTLPARIGSRFMPPVPSMSTVSLAGSPTLSETVPAARTPSAFAELPIVPPAAIVTLPPASIESPAPIASKSARCA